MKANVKNFIIKFTAVSVMFLFFYPAMLIIRMGILKEDTRLFEYFVNAAYLYAGYFIAYFVVGKKDGLIRKTITFLLCVLPAGATVLIHSSGSIWRLLAETAFTVFIYLTGVRTHFIDAEDVLDRKTISIGIIILTASLIVSKHYAICSHFFLPVSYFAYASLVLAMVVKNQQNLDRIFKKKHIDTASVPQNIRRYNTGLIIVLFAIILLLFNLQSMVIFLFKIGGYIILFVLWLIGFLLSPLAGDSGGGQGDGGGTNDLFAELGGESSLLAEIIYGVLTAVVVFIVGYYLIRALIKLFPNLVVKVRSLTSRFINFIKSLFRMGTGSEAGEADYTDQIETIIPKEERKAESKEYKKTDNIKKGLRILKKINDPVKKIRYLYYLILKMLPGKSVQIDASNTTGEIYRKSLQIEGIERDFHRITQIYENVRYGESMPGSDEVEDALSKFSSVHEVLK